MKSWCIGLCRHAVLYHCLYLFERLVTSFFNSPLNLLFLRYVIFVFLSLQLWIDSNSHSWIINLAPLEKKKNPFKHSILDDTFQKRSRSVYRSIKRRRREKGRGKKKLAKNSRESGRGFFAKSQLSRWRVVECSPGSGRDSALSPESTLTKAIRDPLGSIGRAILRIPG